MNKVYVEIKNGLPINVDIQNAVDGFIYLGYQIKTFTSDDLKFLEHASKHFPFVGSTDTITSIFNNIGKLPEPIDFPSEILEFGLMNRAIFKCTLSDVKFQNYFKLGKSLFVKPVKTKLFDGILVSNESHLKYLNDFENEEVYVADEIQILSEHRAYIHKNKLIYCCNYSGDFKINPDYSYICKLINTYKNAPIAYTIDIAILKDGTNTVVEFNDFWSIGGYGLSSWDYANMLKERYFEIINS